MLRPRGSLGRGETISAPMWSPIAAGQDGELTARGRPPDTPRARVTL